MRLYEIEDALPGESLTLRNVIEGGRVIMVRGHWRRPAANWKGPDIAAIIERAYKLKP